VKSVAEVADLIRNEIPQDALPDGPVEELLRSYAVLALALGTTITAEDVHDAWVAWMLARDPDHPSLVPFAELDAETAKQDRPFVSAIRSVAERYGLGRPRPVPVAEQ
jgi:hypothetical protein